MATVNLILYKSKKLKNGKHPVMLRITKNRKRKYISLGYYCTPEQWDDEHEAFNSKFPKHKQRNRVLTKELFRAEDILDEFLDDGKDFTSMISEMMGHSTEAVTQSYLDSFENEAIDKVNELLLKSTSD